MIRGWIFILLVKLTSCHIGQDYKTETNEIKIEKMCYNSESEMSNVLRSFPVLKQLSPDSSDHSGKCGTFIYFPHFTFVFSDKKYFVAISGNKLPKQKLETKFKRSLRNTYSTSYSR